MNLQRGFFLLVALVLVLLPTPAAAQDWDPVKSATGWASFDRDGSCVFLDPAQRKLVNWSREAGVGGEVSLAKMNAPAEKWLLDPSGNAWVVSGATLQLVMTQTGKVGTSYTLPADVADLAWDVRSFVLCFRTREPYLERRDLKTGAVLWTYGTKPAKGTSFPQVLHHVAISEDGKVFLNSGTDFQLLVLDSRSGALTAALPFTLNGQQAPSLALGTGDRGSMAWWLNKNTALLAVPASQLPGTELKGLVLARLDLAKRELVLIPTSADEKAALVGILEDSAVLRLPTGGLGFIPLS